MDKSSFNHFIEHLAGARENSKFKHKQGRLRPKKDPVAISRPNHNQRSQL